MALHHRQLLQQICTIYCHFKDSSCASVDCLSCIQKCSIIIDSPPPDTDNYSLSPPSPSYIDPDLENSSKPHNLPTFLISLIAVLAAAFLLVFCYAFYARFLSPYLRRRRAAAPQETEHAAHDGDDDDDVHGPILDHPIWYIRTTGLQQSIISAITVCKYKKGEGLIDGTECSVCLSEFEEDESLRLLPKCNHAFHLPCIDTWLRSHTNCPNCRAPIVTNPATVIAAAPEPRGGSSGESGEIHIDIVEDSSGRSQIEEGEREEDDRVDQETEEEIEERSEGSGSRNEDVENLQGRRRSVSLDESYVQKINLALAGVATNNNTNNTLSSSSSSLKRVSKSNSSSFRIIGASMKRSRSYNGKHLMTSWYGRSQRKSNVPVRSF